MDEYMVNGDRLQGLLKSEQRHIELLAEVESLRAAVERVRELHTPDQWGECPACALDESGDNVQHPCPTVRALDGEA